MDYIGDFSYVFKEYNGLKKRRYKMKCYVVYMGEKLYTESAWTLPVDFKIDGGVAYSKLKQKTTKQMKLIVGELLLKIESLDYDYDLRSDKWGFPIVPGKRTHEEEKELKERLDKELDEIKVSIKESYEK